VLRLDLKIDDNRLHELVNQHITLRQILGHKVFDTVAYDFDNLKNNVNLFTPELLETVNQLIVDSGYLPTTKKIKRTPAWAVRLLCR